MDEQTTTPTADAGARVRQVAALVAAAVVLALGALATHAGAETDPSAALVLPTPDAPIEVPTFVFDDNPDPDQCGIPQPMGSGYTGTLHGSVDGVVVEPMVHLYDSHLRSEVHGTVQAGSVVEVVMYQSNPVLDFYLVRFRADDGRSVEGWVPAPFLDVHERSSGA
ncbi:MAG: hypothetical protein EA416_17735 [Trueperaceae bacterium]|nr:MAG: hypothetical protein EA416_17735 [Trueperaceae bacterium]